MHGQRMDEIDFSSEKTQREIELRIKHISKLASMIDPGEPGECISCEEAFSRLVRGECARCRDKKNLR